MHTFIKRSGRGVLAVMLSAVLSVLLVAMIAQAATTISENISTGGTLSVTGAVTAASTLSVGGNITLENSETISNSTNGTITLGATNMVLVGTASTSALKVGDEAVPTINGLSFGYCSFGDQSGFAASTTAYVDCTTTPTGALTTSDRVFVQATSSLDSGFIIEAASSTGVSTINLRILNTGIITADTTLGGTSINFWAVRP